MRPPGGAARGSGAGEGESGRFVRRAAGDVSGGAGPDRINSAGHLQASFIRLERLRRGHAEPGLAGLDSWRLFFFSSSSSASVKNLYFYILYIYYFLTGEKVLWVSFFFCKTPSRSSFRFAPRIDLLSVGSWIAPLRAPPVPRNSRRGREQRPERSAAQHAGRPCAEGLWAGSAPRVAAP